MQFLVFCLAITSYVALTSTQTTDTKDDFRIVGGKPIKISEAPYQVALLRNGRTICGGVIIKKRILLTAAHCYNDSFPIESHSIRAGSSFYAKDGVVREVENIVPHPMYNDSTPDYDIAIMKLSEPLEFSEKIAKIGMKDEGEIIPDGEMTIVTGWGRIYDEGPPSNKLRKVALPKIAFKDCESSYKRVLTITPRMYCAGTERGDKDSCEGDSGGPAVHDGKLAGIVSFGIRCAFPGFPGVYTKISSLRKWIDRHVEEMQSKTSKLQKNKKRGSSRPFSSTWNTWS